MSRARASRGLVPVRPALACVACALCLGACTRGNEARSSATPAAKDVELTVAPRAPAPPVSSVGPSYEVAIASAQADRVHALNACDDRQGAAHAACVRAADSAYDAARTSAEKIRGSGR